MTSTKLIEQLIESMVHETLRGFNLEKFKKLSTLEQKIAYAESVLPLMGVGSSRIVFALSGGKVLKIARNTKGLAQNDAEQDIFTNPATKPVVTRIYDADFNDQWLVSEIAQPLSGQQDWEGQLGFSFLVFKEVLSDWAETGMPDENTYMQGKVAAWQARLKELILKGQNQGQIYVVTQRRLKNYIRVSKSPLVKGVMQLVRSGLLVGDLAWVSSKDSNHDVTGHYGKTIDGRIVVLDYGFTGEVYNKHYDKERKGATGASVGDAASGGPPEPEDNGINFVSMSDRATQNRG